MASTPVRLLIAPREPDWVLLRDGVQQGLYRDRWSAHQVADLISKQIRAAGGECDLVVYDEEWTANAFPDPSCF